MGNSEDRGIYEVCACLRLQGFQLHLHVVRS
jgi:hypothetical protein